MIANYLLVIPIAYLLGSIPSGYLAGRWLAGIDIREHGSGSTGATNVLRHVGKTPALIVFLVDVFKGSAAVLVAKQLLGGDAHGWLVAAGLLALTGHIWPIWLKGKGGKAVATGLGMLLGLLPAVGLASLGIFLLVLSFSRIVSLSSVVAALALPALIWIAGYSQTTAYMGLGVLAALLVVWRHRGNIKRLLAGTEPKIGKRSSQAHDSAPPP
ncbi:glycerol-3-phosphate 1-O-acyltransferase PlsY [Synechococcus lacustris]|uniref:glycerol-3-phosphate 1-O-acyltransferase PlsY n=1 Tax=Synechococcus lacustris TaxID=2116544 RepID=UPI0020CFDDF8|nr:glycerol-3-phosphate 1-O-acyltransferase PlsY [Synechococcus lacustris]MCP9793941.1 glycerol-3-phosphate 1-O-acyltransferase PlsY [Synechococcus lacustris L1F-Slac]MCP9813961.1 glycerol-3-phosphate 1-O-acyltransferase PlsY [Synechococcus lacustris L1E-Slac]